MLGDCSPPTTLVVSGHPLAGLSAVQWLAGFRQAWSGAQIQQEVRVGGRKEEADSAGKVRPHPSGPSAFIHLHREVSQESQALLLSVAGQVCLG